MSVVRNAIILAAGMAMRLRPRTEFMPKGLLEIGGKSLLARSVDLLGEVGITEIIVVTGHHGAQIEAALGARRGGTTIRYVRNADYAATGSMVSLLVGLRALADGPILLLESDLLYHPSFLAATAKASDDLILAADLSGSGDEVYLAVDEASRLRFLGKKPPEEWRAGSIGELAGISRLSPALLARFRARAEHYLASGQGNQHYESVLFELAQEGWPIRVEHCPGAPWTEIDTPADLRRAEERVWPLLAPPDPVRQAAP